MGSFETPELVFHEPVDIRRQGLVERLLIGFLDGCFGLHAIGYPVRGFGSFEAVLPVQPIKVDLSGDSCAGDGCAAETNDLCVQVVDTGSAFRGKAVKNITDPGFGRQLFAGSFFVTGGSIDLDAYQVVQYVERLVDIRPHIKKCCSN